MRNDIHVIYIYFIIEVKKSRTGSDIKRYRQLDLIYNTLYYDFLCSTFFLIQRTLEWAEFLQEGHEAWTE